MTENANPNPYIQELRGQAKIPGEPARFDLALERYMYELIAREKGGDLDESAQHIIGFRDILNSDKPQLMQYKDAVFAILPQLVDERGNKITPTPEMLAHEPPWPFAGSLLNYLQKDDPWMYVASHVIIATIQASRTS